MLFFFALLNCFKDRLFMKRYGPAMVFSTQFTDRTRFAVGRLEFNFSEIMEATMCFLCPGITDLALRTSDLTIFPINGKHIDFITCGVLPGMFLDDRADQINTKVSAAIDQEWTRGITHIYNMF